MWTNVPLNLETKRPQLRCTVNLDGHSMSVHCHVTLLAIALTILGIRTKLYAGVYSYFASSWILARTVRHNAMVVVARCGRFDFDCFFHFGFKPNGGATIHSTMVIISSSWFGSDNVIGLLGNKIVNKCSNNIIDSSRSSRNSKDDDDDGWGSSSSSSSRKTAHKLCTPLDIRHDNNDFVG